MLMRETHSVFRIWQ